MNLKYTVLNIFVLFSCFYSMSISADFTSEGELSSVAVSGNTRLKTFLAKSSTTYSYKRSLVLFKGDYTYGESNSIAIAEKWSFGPRYEYNFSKKMSGFLAEQVESDRFNGIDRRYNTDLGLKYMIAKKDNSFISSDIGARYSIEHQIGVTVEDDRSYLAKLRIDLGYEINQFISSLLWVEYLPNFSRSDDYQVNVGPSVTIIMNNVFSLKCSFLFKYDNGPVPGRGKHDYVQTTGIIARF